MLRLIVGLSLLFETFFALRLSGKTTMNSQTQYVGKFCYTYIKGNLNDVPTCGAVDSTISGLVNNASSYYLVGVDDVNLPSFKNPSVSCSRKITPSVLNGGVANLVLQLQSVSQANSTELKEHLRPRWWYFFLVNCDISQSISQEISYDLHFYQLRESSWTQEFGVNEEGLNSMYLAFTVFYFLLASIQIFAYFQYKANQYVHQLIKILTASVVIQFLAALLHFVDWAIYANAGEHQQFFVFAAMIFDVAAMTIFMVLLFLIAQGWTISNISVSYVGPITCFALVVAGFRIGFFAWKYEKYVDSESVKYFFNSPPMYAFGALMIVVGLAYAIQSFISMRNESDQPKRCLYMTLGLLYFVWFLTPLLTILLANTISETYRDTFAQAFVESVNGLALCVMVGMMYPRWAHQYFNLKVGLDAQSMLINATGDYKAIAAGMTTQEDEL